MEPSQLGHLKGAVEALLFVSDKPVTMDQIKVAVPGIGAPDIKEALQALKDEYETRAGGVTISEIAGGWQMLSSPSFAAYVREFYKTKQKEKLSRPALEVLAIIAYKQPVSRADTEVIRGVNSDGVVMHLLNKNLIKIVGRKEVPGRPYVYGTTDQFLEYFGLRALEDLPRLEEFPALMAQVNEASATPNPQAAVAEMPSVLPSVEAPAEPEDTGSVEEALAEARTRLEIEELERRVEVTPGFMDEAPQGESSGQARAMADAAEAESPADADMPDDLANEGVDYGSENPSQ
ncbi:MAG: SMC-Scp complex subunit ScpB [Candidatus Omnitrophica bacterium]|nr:SMC-Scp complex subunit ScpB [Candidatus Omnitrophota bacterium]